MSREQALVKTEKELITLLPKLNKREKTFITWFIYYVFLAISAAVRNKMLKPDFRDRLKGVKTRAFFFCGFIFWWTIDKLITSV